MLEAVSVASRQLLVIDPCDECERLLPRVQAAGWTLRRCRLDECDSLHGDVVHVGRLVQAQRLIAFGDDAGAADDRIVDQHGIGQYEDAEVGAVVRAGHGIEGRRDVVDGVASGQLRSTQLEDELLERCRLGSLRLM